MSTLNQVIKRKKKGVKRSVHFLSGCPQKKGVCVKVYHTKPKKPHSGVRKVAKVYIPSKRRYILTSIPGQGHNLSAHSVVLLRGGRVRDIPGMHFKLIRNKLDFTMLEGFIRTRRRSKYGLPMITLHRNI